MKNVLLALLLLLYSLTANNQTSGNITKVKIVKSKGTFQLLANNNPIL
ncbi:MAG: hypothetical protein JWR18_4041 [Segetibacter sp.]|nr:hypothetical protein [Segetibacter sp.]